jgi:hypothetical protein
MKARWPLKQTMLIRWSAASFRPTIKLGSSTQPERPAAVRLVRPQVQIDDRPMDNGPMWI